VLSGRRHPQRPRSNGHASRALLAVYAAGWLLLAVGLAPSTPVWAANKIEGYYESEIMMERTDENWHFGSPGANGMPKHYAELKFLSWPADNFEAYLKLRAESNRDDDRSPRIDYYAPPWFAAEGHLKLRSDHYEAYVFNRENRFWINDEPLLSLVEDYKLKNDAWGPQAHGVRLDFWNVGKRDRGLDGTLIYSDDGGTFNWGVEGDVPDGVDSFIGRLRPRAFGPALGGAFRSLGRLAGLSLPEKGGELTTGLTILRKDWTDTSNPEYRRYHHLMHNSVYGADMAFSPAGLIEKGLVFGPLNLEQSRWTLEYAFSETPFREQVFGESNRHNSALAAEVRDIHVEDVIFHAWHFDFGEDFRDYLSGRFDNDRREFNRVQNHVEAIWLVPRKAVTAKAVYDYYRKRFADEAGGGRRPAETWYGELYVEFIKGFKGKVAYKQWRGYDSAAEVSDFFTYPEWFGEVSVENFLAKIRLQGRVRDAGTFREVSAFGFDMNVNITESLKGYLRMMNVNEPIEARYTMFAQLKYDIGWGAEFYFEYGDPGQSDNIVYTDWFLNEETNDNLRDRIKLLVKTWF
jgi:hypothetical protein